MAGGTLTIDGADYDRAAQDAAGLAVDAVCMWDLDGDCWMEFHEYGVGSRPAHPGVVPVEYRDSGGVLRFRGVSVGAQPGGGEGRTWGYRCFGLKYLMDQVPVQSPDFSGSIAYNLPLTDEESIPTRRGMSVGDIISAVLTLHASQLAAIGIAADATTAAQLAAMTLVPHDPVYVAGERLAAAIESPLRQYARNHRLQILPTGELRFPDVTAPSGTARTLTLGVDDVHPPMLARDWQHAYSRVLAYGKARVYPFNGRMANDPSELRPAWTDAQRLVWKDADFTTPGDATDYGVVTTTSGPTTITVQSDDPTRAWPVNFWSKRGAWVQLRNMTATGLEYQVAVPVTACTALTAGGTSTLTLGIELDNSAADAWETYQLVGRTGPLEDDGSGTSLSNVWRLFDIATPGGLVEQHLALSSPVQLPFFGLNNASAVMIQSPAALLVKDGVTFPASFRVLPETGQVLFDEPVVRAWNSTEALAAGGAAVEGPDDILFMVPYARGPLQVAHPPDVGGVPQHAGTAHDDDGVERTMPLYVPSWSYDGNAPLIQQLAEMIHASVCDTVVEGDVRCDAAMEDFWDLGDGYRVSIASACGLTGDEALDAPVRSVIVHWNHDGSGEPVAATLRLSTRRDPRTGQDFYLHLSQPARSYKLPDGWDAGDVFAAGRSPGIATGQPAAGAGDWSPLAADPGAAAGDPGRYSPRRVAEQRAAQRRLSRMKREATSMGRQTASWWQQQQRDKRAEDGPTPFGEVVESREKRDRQRAKSERLAESDARRKLGASRPDMGREMPAGTKDERQARHEAELQGVRDQGLAKAAQRGVDLESARSAGVANSASRSADGKAQAQAARSEREKRANAERDAIAQRNVEKAQREAVGRVDMEDIGG